MNLTGVPILERSIPKAMKALARHTAPKKYNEDLHLPLLESLPMIVGPENAAHQTTCLQLLSMASGSSTQNVYWLCILRATLATSLPCSAMLVRDMQIDGKSY